MNDVEQTEVDWLWYPYIPFGKLTIVQGNLGEGKTFFAMQLMLSRFSSYAEVSTSGKGIHIIGQCDITKLPVHFDDRRKKLVLDSEYYQKRSDIGLELYIGDITNRYGTFTGNTINSLPIADCTQAVLTTLDKEMRKKPKAKYSAKRDGDRAVFDIVCDLRKQKNGDKFIRLYDKGDFSEYGSQSEADAALCALIAFRTGADPDAIDEVFRSSALYRSKWERDDYRENTINAGISACNGVFHRSKMEHPDFIKFNEQTGEPYVSVPLLAKYVREHLLVNIVNGQMTVCELVDRYLKTKTGVRQSTKQGYVTVQRLLAKEAFGKRRYEV